MTWVKEQGSTTVDPPTQIVLDAALVALVASRLATTWHAGLISADEAMSTLFQSVTAVRCPGTGGQPEHVWGVGTGQLPVDRATSAERRA